MEIWEFTHNLTLFGKNLHFSEAVAILLAAVMVVVALVHHILKKKRDRQYEEELRKISGDSSPEEILKEAEKA